MPNLCLNEVQVTTSSKEEMDDFISFISGTEKVQDRMSGEYSEQPLEFSFNSIIPEPRKMDSDSHSWRLENWGTKWEPHIYMFDRCGDVELFIEMTTPWSPPDGIYEQLTELFPDVDIVWFYKEPGLQLSGWLGSQ